MADLSDHDMPPTACTGIGIPRQNAFDAAAFERAVSDLLAACGIAPDMQHMGRTAERVRTLWQKRLLGGYDLDPAEALGEGFGDHRRDMVVVRGIAVHGVCPRASVSNSIASRSLRIVAVMSSQASSLILPSLSDQVSSGMPMV